MTPYGGLDFESSGWSFTENRVHTTPTGGHLVQSTGWSQKQAEAVSGGKVWRTARGGPTDVESWHPGWVWGSGRNRQFQSCFHQLICFIVHCSFSTGEWTDPIRTSSGNGELLILCWSMISEIWFLVDSKLKWLNLQEAVFIFTTTAHPLCSSPTSFPLHLLLPHSSSTQMISSLNNKRKITAPDSLQHGL